jgi:hypothetical protein
LHYKMTKFVLGRIWATFAVHWAIRYTSDHSYSRIQFSKTYKHGTYLANLL